MENVSDLTTGERFIVDWQYGRQGGFNTALAKAIMLADADNLEKLRKAYPEEVEAYEKYAHQRGWWEALSKRVGITNLYNPNDI